jgi:hypothetical protein
MVASRDLDGLGSPPRSSWKYAWSGDGGGPPSGRSRQAQPVGAGPRASDRLYQSAKSGRQQREAMQQKLREGPPGNSSKHVSRISAKSASLTANRYENVMAKSKVGRIRRTAMALARARGEEAQLELEREVFNYGDMLFQEAQMSREKRDEWRREQLRQRLAEEDAEATFQPHTTSQSSWAPSGYGAEEDDESVLERFERHAQQRRERQLALRDQLRREEVSGATKRQASSARRRQLHLEPRVVSPAAPVRWRDLRCVPFYGWPPCPCLTHPACICRRPSISRALVPSLNAHRRAR